MSTRKLSPEIVSLIHHVELNKNGWWRKAVGQIIKGVFWTSKKSLNVQELKNNLLKEVGVNISSDVILQHLDVLMSQQEVFKVKGNEYKLSESIFLQLNEAQTEAVKESAQCKDNFMMSCEKYCSGLSGLKVWSSFQRELIQMVSLTGANLFHLLIDGELERETDWIKAFQNDFPEDFHDGLRNVALSFFPMKMLYVVIKY